MASINLFVPKSAPVKAFQIPSGEWIVLNADATEWTLLSDTEFQERYQAA